MTVFTTKATKASKITKSIWFLVFFATVVNFVVMTRAQTEAIAEIRVHGNHTTPEAEILALAGLRVGEPATADRLAQAERVLRESGRFEDVEVRRRYRSIDNPAEILIILLVDERAPAAPMWMPIVARREGHALTYGARVAFVNALGPRTRISAPMTWGGERRAAVEVERTVGATPASPALTIGGSVAVHRTVNPHFDLADNRREVQVRAERVLTPWLRAGGGARVTRVTFGGAPEEWHQAAGAHVTLDTRVDPSFPRNAVHATVGVARLAMSRLKPAPTYNTDLRGYVGLFGPAVLALRGQARHAGAALPISEWALAGGSESVRGYRAGHRAGDSMAAVSAEVRVPVTSPLSNARLGVRGFVDAGAAWNAGEPARKQQYDQGAGGGVYFGFAAVAASVDVAWPERGSPRLHVQLGITN